MKSKITAFGFAVLVAAIVFGLAALSLAGCDSGSGITVAEPLSEKYTVVKDGKTYELTITQSPANAKAKAPFPAEGDSYVLKITAKDATQTSGGTVKAYSNNNFTLAASNNLPVSFEVTTDNSKAIIRITGTITLQDGTAITGPGSLTTSSGGGGDGGGGGGGSGNGGAGVSKTLSGTISISPSGSVAVNTELTATYSGSETVSFQWKKDGGNVRTASTTKPNKFTPAQAGSYTVTVSASGYDSKTSAAVTVTGGGTPITPTFAITMQNDGNGTAAASPNIAEEGEEVTITATPNSGYEFASWQVVSGGVTLSHSAANPADFAMPGNAVTIKAAFALIPPNTPSLSFTTTPTFDDVMLNYAAQTAKNVTFTNGGTGIANVASIVLDSAGNAAFTLGGALTPTVAVGGTATFTVQPKTGLSGGAHEGTITVTYDSGKTAQAEVSFTVRDGSLAYPYLVRNTAELSCVGKSPAGEYADWGLAKHYKQTANIDLASVANWTPIGLNTPATSQFSGSYDGNGHTISNLKITSATAAGVGLFGAIASGATVKNVGIVNCNIVVTVNVVGGVVGGCVGGTVENCYSTGTVTGSGLVGGVAGVNQASGTMKNCYSECNVTGTGTQVGGVVGYNNTGTVQNCYSTGSVSGTTYVGGVVGRNGNNSASVTSPLKNCYSTGNVTGTNAVGGVIGYVNLIYSSPSYDSLDVENCVALNPNVNGTGADVKRVGGDCIFGSSGGVPSVILINCYGRSDLKINGSPVSSSNAATYDGADITSDDWKLASWWEGKGFTTANWDFSGVSATHLPKLKGMPGGLEAQNPTINN